jgi:hypothetical protein
MDFNALLLGDDFPPMFVGAFYDLL